MSLRAAKWTATRKFWKKTNKNVYGTHKVAFHFFAKYAKIAKVTEKIYFSVTDFLKMRFSVFKTNKSVLNCGNFTSYYQKRFTWRNLYCEFRVSR